MKYEIIKGSEKDFEGYPENVLVIHRMFGFDTIGSTTYPSSQFTMHTEIIAERRPITEPVVNQKLTTEWLPEVGERIEYTCIKFDDNRPAIEFGKWYGGTVIAYYDGFVWTSDNGIRRLSNTRFRPIKSPEDVARDEFIKELSGNAIEGFSISTQFAAALYDAGYRKTPTVSELMRVTENATREDCEAIVKMLSGK